MPEADDPKTVSTEERPGDGFYGRWSRRKGSHRAGDASPQESVAAPVPAAPAGGAVPSTKDPGAGEPVLTDADMPDVDTMAADADFSPFLSPGVSEALRRKALRKLFLSAAFNVRDGLDDYDDDFTTFAPLGDIVTSDMRHRMEREAEEERVRAEAEADEQARAGADEQARAGADEQARAGADEQARAGADEQARAGADAQARAEDPAGAESPAEDGTEVRAGEAVEPAQGVEPAEVDAGHEPKPAAAVAAAGDGDTTAAVAMRRADPPLPGHAAVDGSAGREPGAGPGAAVEDPRSALVAAPAAAAAGEDPAAPRAKAAAAAAPGTDADPEPRDGA